MAHLLRRRGLVDKARVVGGHAQANTAPVGLVVQALLRAAPAAGQAAQALAVYERLCLHLHEELGLAPVAETPRLVPAENRGAQRRAA